MKKHKLLNRIALSIFNLALCASLSAGFLTGCKTLPVESPVNVNALDLLDNESAFYIAIPNNVDPELVVRFLQNNIKNMSESDAKLVSKRIANVYCGLNHKKNKTQIQISSDANFGNTLAAKLLNEKNGWKSNIVTTPQNKSYDVYERNTLEISFPSEDIALIGRDIPVMLTQFDTVCAESLGAIGSENEALEENSHLLDDVIYDYLSQASSENEIRFYAGRPQSFLTILTGANLDLRLDHVSGSFVCDPDYPSQYLLKLDFKFKNASYLKAGRGLLTLAFGLTNSNCEIIGDDELVIYDIKIAKNSLYKILVL